MASTLGAKTIKVQKNVLHSFALSNGGDRGSEAGKELYCTDFVNRNTEWFGKWDVSDWQAMCEQSDFYTWNSSDRRKCSCQYGDNGGKYTGKCHESCDHSRSQPVSGCGR